MVSLQISHKLKDKALHEEKVNKQLRVDRRSTGKRKKVIHSSDNDHVFLGTNITWISSNINNH